jgi:transcription termination/antitermination protein NusA
VCNAIAPAEVSRVLIDASTHTMELIVPDEQLSLAIGKKGQNVRLASQLTGWRIDIHSASKVTEMEARARQSLAAISGVTAEVAEALFKAGWRSAAEVAGAKPDELTSITGIANVQAAQAIIAAAGPAAEAERVRQAAEAARIAQQAADDAAAATAAAATAAAAAAESNAAGAAPNPEAP